MKPTAEELWLALREQCCSTNPPTKANAIVMLRKPDLHAALRRVQRTNGKVALPDPSPAIAATLRHMLTFPDGLDRKAAAVCNMVPPGFAAPALRDAVRHYIRAYAKAKGIDLEA